VGGVAGAQSVQRSATDWVTLGKSNVKVTRLAFGTGTIDRFTRAEDRDRAMKFAMNA
jgi:aryl-alcohol dehydrogenase-like predicted oxidoreductase